MFIGDFISSRTAVWSPRGEVDRNFLPGPRLLQVANSFRSVQFEEELYGAEKSNSTHGADNVRGSLDQTCTETLQGFFVVVVVVVYSK